MTLIACPPRIGACSCCGRRAHFKAEPAAPAVPASPNTSPREICPACRKAYGGAKANLIAKARTDPAFAKRCAQNMSRTALAEFVTACDFDSKALIAMGLFPGLRKCEHKRSACRLVKKRV